MTETISREDVIAWPMNIPYWLIERSGEYYAAAPHSDWIIKTAIDPRLWEENWTRDANAALRFCRERDAAALIRFMGLQRTAAVEHADIFRPPPADDGVIEKARAFRATVRDDQGALWNKGNPFSLRDFDSLIALARQAGATGEHPAQLDEIIERAMSFGALNYDSDRNPGLWKRTVASIAAEVEEYAATGEHPVSVVAPCPEGWPDDRVERFLRALDADDPEGVVWPDTEPMWLAQRIAAFRTALKAAPPPPVQLSGNPGELPAPPPIPASALAEAFPDVGPRGQKWCQPGDRPNRQWMLIFDDPDRGRMFWDDEDTELQAREAFAKVWPSWSCTLFCAAPWSPAPPSDAVAELVAACEPFRRAASIRATMTGRGEQTRERFPRDDEVYPAGPITWGMLRRLAAAVAALPSPPSGRE